MVRLIAAAIPLAARTQAENTYTLTRTYADWSGVVVSCPGEATPSPSTTAISVEITMTKGKEDGDDRDGIDVGSNGGQPGEARKLGERPMKNKEDRMTREAVWST